MPESEVVERVVIIGASLAGTRAAQALRAAGFVGQLTVLGAEEHPPYQRPPLSKGLLAEGSSPESLALPIGGLDVEWRLSTEAVGVDPVAREVELADGELVGYDRLVIATGSRARGLAGYEELDWVKVVRTLEDSLDLRERLRPGARALVLGAGFLGCEVAAAARARGVEVTLCDLTASPLAHLGPEIGQLYSELHQDHGVETLCGTSLSTLDERDGRRQATLANGRKLDVDVVVLALGAEPATGFLAASGLPVSDGVLCDATLTVDGHPDVMAAGDVARWPHPLADADGLRVEHFTTAGQQGRHVGANLLLPVSERAAFDATPSCWSDQHGVNLQTVGVPRRATSTVVLEGDPGDRQVVVAGCRDGSVVSVTVVGAPARTRKYRALLEDGPVSLGLVLETVNGDARALPVPTR